MDPQAHGATVAALVFNAMTAAEVDAGDWDAIVRRALSAAGNDRAVAFIAFQHITRCVARNKQFRSAS